MIMLTANKDSMDYFEPAQQDTHLGQHTIASFPQKSLVFRWLQNFHIGKTNTVM
jgi:hypothetical protein